MSEELKTPRELSDYPQGDGHLKCSICRGRGVIVIPQKDRKPWMIGEITRQCVCTIKRDQHDNIKRAWRAASAVPLLKATPLIRYSTQNLRLRSDAALLKQHIRTFGMQQKPHWFFKVITDVDLMTSWLYSANEVFDSDVGMSRLRGENQSSRITDLVEPWNLLILRLGVKAARNSATHEVLLEALLHREQVGKPTWVVDTQDKPFYEGHLAWSPELDRLLKNWEFLDLSENSQVTPSQRRRPTPRKQVAPPVASSIKVGEEDDLFSSMMNIESRGKKKPKKGWKNH